MAGLLDGALDNDMTRFGLGLLAASGPTNDPMKGAFGNRLMQAVGSFDDYRQQKSAQERAKRQEEYQAFQMEQMKVQAMQQQAARQQTGIDDAAVRGAFTPMDGGRAMANGMGPTNENAQNIGQMQAFDPRQFLAQNPQASLGALKTAMETNSAINPKKKFGYQTVGDNLLRTDEEGNASSVFTALPKPEKLDPNKPFMVVDGKIVPNDAYQAFALKERRAGASNVSLSTAGPKAFETELGKMDAEQLGKWRDGAMTAQSTLSTVKKLEEADAKGAYSGGAANLKMTVGSYINGITGATPKGQIGSELYNAEAGKLVLDQIKTLGANPSNADREFIQKTVPQLSTNADARRQMTKFMADKAEQAINLYNRANSHARKNSGLGGFNVIEPTSDIDALVNKYK